MKLHYLGDKMKLREVNCFMRVPLVYLPSCPVPNCLGKQGEFSRNCFPNLTVRFNLSPSISRKRFMFVFTRPTLKRLHL